MKITSKLIGVIHLDYIFCENIEINNFICHAKV